MSYLNFFMNFCNLVLTFSFFLENIKIPRRAGGVLRDALPVRRWRRVRKRYCARRIPSRRGAKIVRACARSTGLPQLSARHAEALPYSFNRPRGTARKSSAQPREQPPYGSGRHPYSRSRHFTDGERRVRGETPVSAHILPTARPR